METAEVEDLGDENDEGERSMYERTVIQFARIRGPL